MMVFFQILLLLPSIACFQGFSAKFHPASHIILRHITKLPVSRVSESLSMRGNNVKRKFTSLLMSPQQGQYTSFWGIFVTGLQFAGPIFFLSLQFSSVLTAIEITKSRSCGSLSPLPFISLFTNSFVWSLYGLLKMDGTVFIPNSCGVLASLFCILAFHKHTLAKPNKLYIGSIVISCLALCLATTGNYPFIGILGCFLSVLLSGSPLAVMRTVIKDKSTAALPFSTSFVIWLNSISWLLYGLLVAHDILIYGPNVLGFMLASLQMSLFAIYGIKPTVKERKEVQSKIWFFIRHFRHQNARILKYGQMSSGPDHWCVFWMITKNSKGWELVIARSVLHGNDRIKSIIPPQLLYLIAHRNITRSTWLIFKLFHTFILKYF